MARQGGLGQPGEGRRAAPGEAGPGRGALAAAGLALAVAVVAGYLPSIDGGMQFDDVTSIEQHLALKDLGQFLSSTFWDGLGRGSRAVTDLTFAVNYAQGRLEPRPYHLTNLACHLLATLLLFLLGRRLLQRAGWPGPGWPALAAAALWALHPLNSQAVSYIVQRAEVLASIGYAGAVLLLLGAARRGRSPAGAACLAGALGAALLGYESKPILIGLPAAVLAALWAADLPERPSPRRAWAARLALAAPFALASLWYGSRSLAASAGTRDMGFDIPELQGVSYPASQVRVVLAYLGQLVWPAGLALDHDVAPSRSWLEPAVLASALALLALVAGAALLARRTARDAPGTPLARAARLALFGVAWWFILLSPTSSVVPLADLMMDHRPYLASWGLLLGAVALAAALLGRLPAPGARAAGWTLTLALSAALGLALHQRNLAWASPEATWADVTLKHPGLWRGWQNRAQQEWLHGRTAAAIGFLEEAMKRAATPRQRLETLRNLSANLMQAGDLDRALAVLAEADRLGLDDAMVKFNIAVVLTGRGRLDEAEPFARRAIELDPESPLGHAALAQIRGRRGDHAGALAEFQAAAALDPDAVRPALNVAVALGHLGRRREACAVLERCASLPGGAAAAAPDRARLGCDRLEAGTP